MQARRSELTSSAPDETPAGTTPAGLRAKERAENFPVAMSLLPTSYRHDLRAVYDVVRVIDDLGDQAAGDRSQLLEAFAADLHLAWDGGSPDHAVCRALRPVVVSRRLSLQAFDQLVQANLMDQRVDRYPGFEDLHGYCMLSAAPVGRLVLEVFGESTKENLELSDRICVALQLVEHWQDVAEDLRAGRVYLPAEDLVRFGVAETDLASSTAAPQVRALVRFETARASTLLDSGASLVGRLHGWARLAVAGYVGGGRATVDALRRADGDVLSSTPRPRTRDLVRHASRSLRGSRP